MAGFVAVHAPKPGHVVGDHDFEIAKIRGIPDKALKFWALVASAAGNAIIHIPADDVQAVQRGEFQDFVALTRDAELLFERAAPEISGSRDCHATSSFVAESVDSMTFNLSRSKRFCSKYRSTITRATARIATECGSSERVTVVTRLSSRSSCALRRRTDYSFFSLGMISSPWPWRTLGKFSVSAMALVRTSCQSSPTSIR